MNFSITEKINNFFINNIFKGNIKKVSLKAIQCLVIIKVTKLTLNKLFNNFFYCKHLFFEGLKAKFKLINKFEKAEKVSKYFLEISLQILLINRLNNCFLIRI
jgi:hypothetical protein